MHKRLYTFLEGASIMLCLGLFILSFFWQPLDAVVSFITLVSVFIGSIVTILRVVFGVNLNPCKRHD